MSSVIKAWWMLSPNFGDALTPWLIKKAGKRPVYDKDKSLLMAGSILNHAKKDTVVWGAGLAWSDEPVPNCKILAVRGELTRQKCLEAEMEVQAVGDPGLLIQRYYNPYFEKKQRNGLLPHYIDAIKCDEFIDILNPIERVVDDILACERVLTSSLHGLIACNVYRIPCLLVKMSDNIGGDGYKYRDYFSSVGIDAYEPVDIRDIGLDKAYEQCFVHDIEFNQNQLLKCNPLGLS